MEAEISHHTHPSTLTKDAVTKITELPEELITEILVRLPVKSILQVKSVRKGWLALISTPQFVGTHLSFSAKNFTRQRLMLACRIKNTLRHCFVRSLFYDSVTHALDFDYHLKDPIGIVGIVGSVNGLICYTVGINALVLCNPSNRKFKQLFDPTHAADSCCCYGFGYDNVHDDYKVVSVFGGIGKRYYKAKIYSLKSDSWRKLDDFQSMWVDDRSGKLVKGKLHWLTVVDDGGGWRIMSIDLVDEKCMKVEQPCGEGHSLLKIGVLGSDLSVLCRHAHAIIDVWVMKDYGVKGSWTRLYTIKCLDYVLSPPLCMSIEGESLHVLDSTLTIYNLEDDLMRYPEVTNIDKATHVYGYLTAELYIESLVSPVLQNDPLPPH